MTLDRRTFLKGAGAGALLLAHPGLSRASLLGGPVETSAVRTSKLFADGRMVVHADMHNHTLFSDGNGNPEATFASMRAAGLDVAAVTDHTTVSKGLPVSVCGGDTPCSDLGGLNDITWDRWRQLADAANEPHAFTAIRGFEWSSPSMGHVNVWFSETYTDPLHDAGATTGEGGTAFIRSEGGPVPGPVHTGYETAMRTSPSSGASMAAFYEWLAADPSRGVRGGGSDAICGFNHPGREPGRFGYFDPRFRDVFGIGERVVSMEIFNRGEDYLFEGIDHGQPSPLVDCLDKGWRVGLTGVTDEHGTNWGFPTGKGRTGVWVAENTRSGVREAMLARRFFATRERGLRLDASLDGVRMGSTIGTVGSTGTVALDLSMGPENVGRPVRAQVLVSGYPMPIIAAEHSFVIPGEDQPPVTFPIPIDADDRWVVIRISDPAREADKRASGAYKTAGRALAYTSPFFIAR